MVELPGLTVVAKLNANDAEALIDAATASFSGAVMQRAIKATLKPTKDFLLRNNAQMDESGNRKARSRWLDNSKYDPTDSWLRTELRKTNLRRLVAGHGFMHILAALDEGGHLPETAREYFDDATNLEALQAIEVLVARDLAPNRECLSMNLEDLKPLFGYSPGANADAVRNKWVIPMVCLGLWSAKVRNPFEVRVGPVSREFYEKVFEPVVLFYDAVLESKDPAARHSGDVDEDVRKAIGRLNK